MTGPMDSNRWSRIEALYLEALDRSPSHRAAFIDDAAAGDADLRDELLSLLAAHADDPDFLGEPMVQVSDVVATEADAIPSEAIGNFRVVRPIGRGGMGEVYLARQEGEGFELFVALKIIRGGMATDEVLERFRLERRILARLRHPNIAQLLDGGATADGRPYLAMEYVDGKRLDAYCDEARLSVRDRLVLFRKICDAVQHAHSHLVLHRDLKPGNIAVTSDGVPKLLDFGIGKILDPQEHASGDPVTRTGIRVVTPEYASPEQLRGDAVSVASDVYQLGVVLFGLLCGRTPFSGATQGELERAVADGVSTRPSAALLDAAAGGAEPQEIARCRRTDAGRLQRTLSGDLDNIVLKALRLEPERRYVSATALSDDIGRYLDGLPVRARADTFGYVAGKFVRRHVWPLAAAAVAFVALGGSTLYTSAQSRRVAEERDKAVEVQGFLMEMFGASDPNQTGDSVTARALLDTQLETLENNYGDRPALHAQMLAVLAEGYDRLGLQAEAEPLARRALDMRREALPADHPDIAASLALLGWILHQAGSSEEAVALLGESVPVWRAAGSDPAGLSRALNDLGVVLEAQGDYAEAEARYTEALDIRRNAFGPSHRRVAVTASNLAVIRYRQGNYGGAAEMAEQALDAMRAAVGADHPRSITIQSNLAAMRLAQGDVAGAEGVYRDLVARQTELQGPDHPITLGVMNALGTTLVRQEKWAEAEEVTRQTLTGIEGRVGPNHAAVGQSLLVLGRALSAQGKNDEALAAQERALDIMHRNFGDTHERVAEALAAISETYERIDQPDEAERILREAIAVYDAALGSDHPQSGEARSRLARRLLVASRGVEALELFHEAEAVFAATRDEDDPFRIQNRLFIAQALILLDELDAADSVLAVTGEQLRSAGAPNNLRALQDTLESHSRDRRTAG